MRMQHYIATRMIMQLASPFRLQSPHGQPPAAHGALGNARQCWGVFPRQGDGKTVGNSHGDRGKAGNLGTLCRALC